ncbi:unnamed protein product [Clonostachys solani]|uniref:Secreted protein n=1 Tax=Clonostachys solani TaxID=160281 RepID=A0A9N9Z7E3_9HYPO|nr:unnamed protein product [Clonostachys solani]
MKVLSVLTSALVVAVFAAGMPTPMDASNSTNTTASTNTNVSTNINASSNTTASTITTASTEDSEDSEARRKENWEELADPILGHPYIDDPDAHYFTYNKSRFYEAARIPNDSIKHPFVVVPESTYNAKPRNEFKCLESNQMFWFPRMSWQFKGYCEHEYGQCFLKALRKRGAIVHNWQCWKRDDGWWQADYTHMHAYLAVIPEYNEALREVIGFFPYCE